MTKKASPGGEGALEPSAGYAITCCRTGVSPFVVEPFEEAARRAFDILGGAMAGRGLSTPLPARTIIEPTLACRL